jgi:sec-independent protein translocase protein TatA
MFDNLLTPSHLIIVLVIALLIFGPSKLPQLGKGLGEGFRGFKDGLKGEAPTPETPATKTEVTEVK